jgi:electron transfer flavoprotein alpha subunit
VEAAAEKPGIFISYARSDSSALAEELVAGLELAGFRPFLDRHDIARRRIGRRLGALILGADTIVFILSPAAVRSERCAWEVDRAAELGKRLRSRSRERRCRRAEVPERLRRLSVSSSAKAKDLLPRVAALLDAGMVSDVIAVEGARKFKRPMLAGNALAHVEVSTPTLVASVRQTESQSALHPSPRFLRHF